jgi:bifunctional DNA-binding transcriptional regulator/antitoxin component of YhaV-PrlF toxin-antitoxin module
MRTTLTVSDEGILTFPDDIMKELGWKEGDELEWIDNKDGSFSLKNLKNPPKKSDAEI